jgi:hypothetical protein
MVPPYPSLHVQLVRYPWYQTSSRGGADDNCGGGDEAKKQPSCSTRRKEEDRTNARVSTAGFIRSVLDPSRRRTFSWDLVPGRRSADMDVVTLLPVGLENRPVQWLFGPQFATTRQLFSAGVTSNP